MEPHFYEPLIIEPLSYMIFPCSWQVWLVPTIENPKKEQIRVAKKNNIIELIMFDCWWVWYLFGSCIYGKPNLPSILFSCTVKLCSAIPRRAARAKIHRCEPEQEGDFKGFLQKPEVFRWNTRFLLCTWVNTGFQFKPDKFLGYGC